MLHGIDVATRLRVDDGTVLFLHDVCHIHASSWVLRGIVVAMRYMIHHAYLLYLSMPYTRYTRSRHQRPAGNVVGAQRRIVRLVAATQKRTLTVTADRGPRRGPQPCRAPGKEYWSDDYDIPYY